MTKVANITLICVVIAIIFLIGTYGQEVVNSHSDDTDCNISNIQHGLKCVHYCHVDKFWFGLWYQNDCWWDDVHGGVSGE